MIVSEYHRPVLLRKVLDLLKIEKGRIYLDATVGGGGYTREILKKGGFVLALDADINAVEFLRKDADLAGFLARGELILENENFIRVEEIADKHGIQKFQGAVFDLGLYLDGNLDPDDLDRPPRLRREQKDCSERFGL